MLGQKRFGKFQTAALVVIALVMGANLISPAVAHFKPKLGHLIKHVFVKADRRYYNVGEKVGAATTADSATNATNATNAASADKLDGQDSSAFASAAGQLSIGIGNGVASELDCASGTVEVGITDANGQPADHRFTFQTPGANQAYGQIRDDGSIRNSSANVSAVAHTTGSGMYCISFSGTLPTQADRESTVVSLHFSS